MRPLLDWVHESQLSAAIAESTWGFPILAALHVLALGLFGGTAILPHLRELRTLRRAGLAALVLTGGLLFWSQPLRYYYSNSFRVKMALLLLLALANLLRPASRLQTWSLLALWAGVILASRGIAFF